MADPATMSLHDNAVQAEAHVHQLAVGLAHAGANPQAIQQLTAMTGLLRNIAMSLAQGPPLDNAGQPQAAQGPPQGAQPPQQAAPPPGPPQHEASPTGVPPHAPTLAAAAQHLHQMAMAAHQQRMAQGQQ